MAGFALGCGEVDEMRGDKGRATMATRAPSRVVSGRSVSPQSSVCCDGSCSLQMGPLASLDRPVKPPRMEGWIPDGDPTQYGRDQEPA